MFPTGKRGARQIARKFWRGCRVPALGVAAGLIAGACSSDLGAQGGAREACAARRLKAAVVSYEDAKGQFAEHFRGRSDSSLLFAYHASVDSERLARSLGSCFDFDDSHRASGTDLIRSNQIFRRLVVNNLRDSDPGVVIALFGEDYRDFIRKDIH